MPEEPAVTTQIESSMTTGPAGKSGGSDHKFLVIVIAACLFSSIALSAMGDKASAAGLITAVAAAVGGLSGVSGPRRQ